MRSGFTLVEISIVLVIIGLLIGGILAAQAVIESAKVNKLATQLQQYEIAGANFYNNYKSYPGDSPMFDPAGNNNGRMDNDYSGCTKPGDLSANEQSQAWTHLSQSNMLGGKEYIPWGLINGACDDFWPADYYFNPRFGLSVPVTKIKNEGPAAEAYYYGATEFPLQYGIDGISVTVDPLQGLALRNKFGNVQVVCAYGDYGDFTVDCTSGQARAAQTYFMFTSK